MNCEESKYSFRNRQNRITLKICDGWVGAEVRGTVAKPRMSEYALTMCEFGSPLMRGVVLLA